MSFTHNARGKIDWAIIGLPLRDGGVRVFASDSLTQFQMSAILDEVPWGRLGEALYAEATYDIRGKMARIVTAKGSNYSEALANLFSQWEPKDQTKWALKPERPSLLPPQ